MINVANCMGYCLTPKNKAIEPTGEFLYASEPEDIISGLGFLKHFIYNERCNTETIALN